MGDGPGHAEGGGGISHRHQPAGPRWGGGYPQLHISRTTTRQRHPAGGHIGIRQREPLTDPGQLGTGDPRQRHGTRKRHAAELIAEKVYASVDALAAALQVKLGTLSGATVGASGPAVPTTTVRSHCDRVFEGLP